MVDVTMADTRIENFNLDFIITDSVAGKCVWFELTVVLENGESFGVGTPPTPCAEAVIVHTVHMIAKMIFRFILILLLILIGVIG